MANLPDTAEVLSNLTTAIEDYKTVLVNQSAAQTRVFEAKKGMADAQNAILTEYSDTNKHPGGLKDLGSNAENRKAALEQMTQKECFEVQQAEYALIQAQNDAHIAKLEVDKWRYSLRALEVASGITAVLATR